MSCSGPIVMRLPTLLIGKQSSPDVSSTPGPSVGDAAVQRAPAFRTTTSPR